MAKSLPSRQQAFAPPPPPTAPAAPGARRSPLWAALAFPRLSLEVWRADIDDDAWVVVQEQRGQPLVQAASQPARAQGVAPGMALPQAYALCPALQTEVRDLAAEQACLAGLADWAGQYSAVVSLDDEALLLEIGGSLRLFGGLEALRASVQQDLMALPHTVDLAVTPTPQSALLLARCGIAASVTAVDELRSALGQLPLTVLPVEAKTQRLFERLGLRSLHELWRLPREGLLRRCGPDFMDYLERLLGRKPEPRLTHRSAPGFEAHWTFPLETDNTHFVLHAVGRLLPKLIRFMRVRDLALDRLRIVFQHPGRQTSELVLGMQRLCRDAEHITALLRERLDREALAAPVLALSLRVDDFHPFLPDHAGLFDTGPGGDEAARQRLLDRLRNRLGEQAVTGLRQVDDHRPEYAWRYAEPQAGEGVAERPLWLLPRPVAQGNLSGLTWLAGPERIEGGWWDGRDLRRDYYQARDRRGRHLWLFRDLRDGGWYLHGLFA